MHSGSPVYARLVMAIDPEDVRKGLADNNVTVLEFLGETYKRMHG